MDEFGEGGGGREMSGSTIRWFVRSEGEGGGEARASVTGLGKKMSQFNLR